MQSIAKWTIGNTNRDGYDCLSRSIDSFTKCYNCEVVICHNCECQLLPQGIKLFDQRIYAESLTLKPFGVSWKLYPPRLNIDCHEISIDNDIVFNKRIPEIDVFLESDCTLLLEGNSRTYGQFERFVPPGKQINSGIYGMPPNFDLKALFDFYIKDWQKNALGEHDKNETFDEQGFVAFALLNYRKSVIISQKTITNCEYQLNDGDGYHFIGLNRRKFHHPYRLYRSSTQKLYL